MALRSYMIEERNLKTELCAVMSCAYRPVCRVLCLRCPSCGSSSPGRGEIVRPG